MLQKHPLIALHSKYSKPVLIEVPMIMQRHRYNTIKITIYATEQTKTS